MLEAMLGTGKFVVDEALALTRVVKVTDMPQGVSNFTAGLGGGFIHYAGGVGTNDSPRYYRKYDIANKVWTSSAQLSSIWTWSGGTFAAGALYGLGGGDNSGYSTVPYRWNPVDMTMTSGFTTLPGGARGQTRCIEHNGFIYVFNGYSDANGHYNGLHRYDPVANTWATMVASGVATNGSYAGKYGNNLYFMGGYSSQQGDLATLRVYSVAGNNWGNLYNFATPMSWVGGFVWNKYAALCYNSSGVIIMQVYDLVKGGSPRIINTGIPQRWAGEWLADERGVWLLGGAPNYVGSANYGAQTKFTDVYFIY